MDLPIQRPSHRCARTDRPLAPGEVFFSALVREGGRLRRVDIAAEAWTAPPAGALAWWRSAAREPAAASTPVLASPDVLLDVLERLEGAEEEESLRYLLGLHLVRRRVLRFAEAGPAGEHVVLTCRRRNCDYRLRCAPPANAMAAEERLVSLLWSGAAA